MQRPAELKSVLQAPANKNAKAARPSLSYHNDNIPKESGTPESGSEIPQMERNLQEGRPCGTRDKAICIPNPSLIQLPANAA